MSYRMQANRMTRLTPHEMLTGRPMLSPTFRGPHKEPPLEQLEIKLKKYIRQLAEFQSRRTTTKGGGARWPVVSEGVQEKVEGAQERRTIQRHQCDTNHHWGGREFHLVPPQPLHQSRSTTDGGGPQGGAGCRCTRYWTTTPGPERPAWPGTTDTWWCWGWRASSWSSAGFGKFHRPRDESRGKEKPQQQSRPGPTMTQVVTLEKAWTCCKKGHPRYSGIVNHARKNQRSKLSYMFKYHRNMWTMQTNKLLLLTW